MNAASGLEMVLRDPDQAGQLRHLNLSRQFLASLPAEILLLTSIRVLYLNYNYLSSFPPEFGMLLFPQEKLHVIRSDPSRF
jgi:Leucine-rich repeat (LRR) protein